ncbi:hypothetical protein AVEN_40691-1 [Araneus ventricosus]|uniref:Uncharacterized protein n=1 Tax=Araneus ventricosus TaxID=182803 RepID=A0A4Y2U5M5_ARAVE|nr:hypothetical protein AVEN_40691-1 [Araneus ventricosus]
MALQHHFAAYEARKEANESNAVKMYDGKSLSKSQKIIDNHLETILFFNIISTNVDVLIPSFYQRPNSICTKFFGLLSQPQSWIRDSNFMLIVFIISLSSSDENRLGLSLGCNFKKSRRN